MTEGTPPGMVTAADITEEYGLAPETIKFYLSRSRRRERAGTLDQWDMPLPVDRIEHPRTEPGKGPGYTVEHLWDAAAIARWRRAGRRPLPERDRVPPGQPEGGRWLGREAS